MRHKPDEIENAKPDRVGNSKETAKVVSSQSVADNLVDGTDNDETNWMSHWDLLVALFILVVILVLEYGFRIVLPKMPSLLLAKVASKGV